MVDAGGFKLTYSYQAPTLGDPSPTLSFLLLPARWYSLSGTSLTIISVVLSSSRGAKPQPWGACTPSWVNTQCLQRNLPLLLSLPAHGCASQVRKQVLAGGLEIQESRVSQAGEPARCNYKRKNPLVITPTSTHPYSLMSASLLVSRFLLDSMRNTCLAVPMA